MTKKTMKEITDQKLRWISDFVKEFDETHPVDQLVIMSLGKLFAGFQYNLVNEYKYTTESTLFKKEEVLDSMMKAAKSLYGDLLVASNCMKGEEEINE